VTAVTLALIGITVLPPPLVVGVPSVRVPNVTPMLPLLTGVTVTELVAVLLIAFVAVALTVSVPLAVGCPVAVHMIAAPAARLCGDVGLHETVSPISVAPLIAHVAFVAATVDMLLHENAIALIDAPVVTVCDVGALAESVGVVLGCVTTNARLAACRAIALDAFADTS
jgi:hypothetical protein